MEKALKCSIVIYDDFNNVLILQRGKAKKGEMPVWSLFEKEVKGKATLEKTITKAVDKDIKCTIFDLENFKEYDFDEEKLVVFKGMIKERVTLHKTIADSKWVKLSDLNKYNFNNIDRKIIEDFFLS